MFLSSEKGKRILGFCYSWGASIVIIGALLKILHIPYANQILTIAMTAEALVFFISAFEKPSNDYNWEDVFPVLKSKNPLDRIDFNTSSITSMLHAEANLPDDTASASETGANLQREGSKPNIHLRHPDLSSAIDVSEEDTKNLSDSIKKLSGAAEQISKMAALTEATQQYMEQLSGMSENMQRFSQVTNSLTDVSDTLLNAYKSITDNSEGISQNSRGYVHQMEALNRNISGLNTIYEIQLKGISSQIDSIEQINSGLNRIKDLYDGSVVDSSVFRNETEKMAQQLTQLNQVYGRLLQAMTVNMYGAGVQNMPPPQQQQAYQQPYQQPAQANPYQTPYTNNPGQQQPGR